MGGGGGGGGEGHKSWKHDFEIIGDPKGPTFWWGFETPDSYGYLWGTHMIKLFYMLKGMLLYLT